MEKEPVISINDLKRHNKSILSELQEVISRVIEGGWYILGDEVAIFETEFADFCGAKYCVGVGNGTDALELSLRALDIGPGDRVATVANAGMYSTAAILAVGAIPVYVDIADTSLTMDPRALSEVVEKVRAVIVTHLYGQMADIESLIQITERVRVPVIEDCAQAHGAQKKGRSGGVWGLCGCFSFYPTKNLGALGDAGAVITSDENFAKKIRQLRQYGWTRKYLSKLPGGRNSRLDELQAATLRVKLRHLDHWNNMRRRIAQSYSKEFQRLGLIVPYNFERDYVAHLYVVRTPRRDQLKEHLTKRGIMTDIHYPIPDYLQDSIKALIPTTLSLDITEKSCREVLTLPCFPEMTELEVRRVMTAVSDALT